MYVNFATMLKFIQDRASVSLEAGSVLLQDIFSVFLEAGSIPGKDEYSRGLRMDIAPGKGQCSLGSGQRSNKSVFAWEW